MSPAVPIGVGRDGPVTIPEELLTSHWIVSGMTGAGKTGFLLGLARTAIRRGIGTTLVDPKGEGVQDAIMFAAGLQDGLAAGRVRVIAPFRTDVGVRFGLLAPHPSLPAPVLASLITDLLDRLAEGFGERMKRLTYRVVLAALDAGVGLRDAMEALRNEEYCARLAARVRDAETRQYLRTTLPREKASAEAVLARLEWLCRIPGLAHSLYSRQSLTDDDVLPPGGLTLVDLGGAPQGCDAIANFVGQLFMLRATGAVFSRAQGRLTAPARPHLVIVDEAQRIMRESAGDTERLLCEARSFRVGLVLGTQSFGNRSFDDKFRTVLGANVAHQLVLRPDEKEIDGLRPLLPVTGRVRDTRRPDRLLDPREEQAAMIDILRTLPSQHGLFATRGRPIVRMRTLAQPYARAADAVRGMPQRDLDAYRNGCLAVPASQLAAEAELRLTPELPEPAREAASDTPPVPTPARTRSKRTTKLVLG